MNKPINKYYYFEFSDTLFLKLNYICNTLDPVLKTSYAMTKNTTDLVNDSIVQEFQGLIDQGNDFFKIELLRPAKKCYKKALELNINQEKVQQKIAECDRLLTFEKKVVWILSAITAAAILLWILFK